MNIDKYLQLVQADLNKLSELDGVGVVVDLQQDLEEMKRETLAMSKGYCVMIGEVSNRSADRNSSGPYICLKYGVTIYSPKIIKAGCITGSAIRDAVIRALHHSRLQDDDGHCYDEAVYIDGRTFEETEKNLARMIHATSFEVLINY